jgi:hypothetical protein
MRVAFFGLDFHARTGSSRFLLDLVVRHATVDCFFAAPDVAAVRRAAPGFDEARYDAIIVWQLHEAFALLSGRHPNVTFAPMLDAMWRGGAFTWRPSFNAAKLLCFSWALRRQAMRRAPVRALVQYDPGPAARPAVRGFDALRGVFWYRRRDISPGLVFALTAGARFESLAIHDAPDPGHAAPFPAEAPAHVGHLLRSTWSADRTAYADAPAAANVFFAPRPMEGIGMAVLEAMAASMCVAAPDAPTMNEYVSLGSNGLLYAPGARAPADLSRAAAIGAQARAGHRDRPGLAATGAGRGTPADGWRHAPAAGMAAPMTPRLSTVTPCLNGAGTIGAAIDSVLAQGRPSIEQIIVDGGSTDGMAKVLARARLAESVPGTPTHAAYRRWDGWAVGHRVALHTRQRAVRAAAAGVAADPPWPLRFAARLTGHWRDRTALRGAA